MAKLLDLSFLDDDYQPADPHLGQTPADLPGDWYVLWDERAAAMEYDAGMPREQAEHLALLDILSVMSREAIR